MSLINFLSPINFSFNISYTPDTSYAIQRVSVPGIQISTPIVQTPFMSIPFDSNMDHDDLVIEFKVGENLEGYMEIYKWLRKIGRPEDFTVYEQIRSDADLIIMNSSKRNNIIIHFRDLYPTSLGPLNMDVTDQNVTPVTATATFKYLSYDFV